MHAYQIHYNLVFIDFIVTWTQFGWRFCFINGSLVVSFGFLPQKFGPMVGTYEGHLLFCECSFFVMVVHRSWWEHLNTTHCNQTYLKFLHSELMGTEKKTISDCPCTPHTFAPQDIGTTHEYKGAGAQGCEGCKGIRVQEYEGYKSTRVWVVQG